MQTAHVQEKRMEGPTFLRGIQIFQTTAGVCLYFNTGVLKANLCLSVMDTQTGGLGLWDVSLLV